MGWTGNGTANWEMRWEMGYFKTIPGNGWEMGRVKMGEHCCSVAVLSSHASNQHFKSRKFSIVTDN